MIRVGTLNDLTARGGHLLAAAAKETGIGAVPDEALIRHVDELGLLLVLLVEHEGKLVGYALACLEPEVWRIMRCCACWSVYVQPDRRGTYGAPLIRKLIQAGREAGADLVRVPARYGERHCRMLERLGMVPRSVAYEMDLRQRTPRDARSRARRGG